MLTYISFWMMLDLFKQRVSKQVEEMCKVWQKDRRMARPIDTRSDASMDRCPTSPPNDGEIKGIWASCDIITPHYDYGTFLALAAIFALNKFGKYLAIFRKDTDIGLRTFFICILQARNIYVSYTVAHFCVFRAWGTSSNSSVIKAIY